MFPFSPKTAKPPSKQQYLKPMQPQGVAQPSQPNGAMQPTTTATSDPALVGAKVKYVSKSGKRLSGTVLAAIPGGYEVVTSTGNVVLIRAEAVLGGISSSAAKPPPPSPAVRSSSTVQFKVGDVVLYSGREFQITAVQVSSTMTYYELGGLAWASADQLTLSMSAPVAAVEQKLRFCTCGEQWVSGVAQLDRHSGWCDLKVKS